jgi:HEAT repeat protein
MNNPNMRKGRWFLTTAAILLAMAAAIAWLLSKPDQPAPVYQGKPLSYWLEGWSPGICSLTTTNSPPPTWDQTEEAFKGMGNSAIPVLMRMLAQKDSPAKQWIWRILRSQRFFKIKPMAQNPRWSARLALAYLGPAASNAVPQLIAMLKKDPSAFAQTSATGTLGYIGPAAKPAVPVLLQRGITHTNEQVRNNSIFALRKIHPDAGLVVPEFIKCLNDPDVLVRGQAARALGDYGADAQAAVPMLLDLYRKEPRRPGGVGTISLEGAVTSSDWGPLLSMKPPDVKNIAAQALVDIDPKTATREAVSVREDPNIR